MSNKFNGRIASTALAFSIALAIAQGCDAETPQRGSDTRSTTRYTRVSVDSLQIIIDRTSNRPSVEDTSASIDSIVPRRTLGNDSVFAFIEDMAAFPEVIVVTDSRMKHHGVVVDRTSGEVLHQFAREGGGPTEIRGGAEIQKLGASPPVIRLYSQQLKRFSHFELSPPDYQPVLQMTRPLRLDRLVTDVQSIEGGQLVGNGMLGEDAVVVLDSAGMVDRRIWFPPPYTSDDIEHPRGVRQLNRNSIAVQSRDKIALAYQGDNRIAVMRGLSGPVILANGPRRVNTSWTIRNGDFGLNLQKHEPAYVSVRASRSHIYALFCGCSFNPKEKKRPLPNKVHIFDWQGQFEGELRLSRRVSNIQVSKGDSLLWGLSQQPIPRLAEWELPDWLQ